MPLLVPGHWSHLNWITSLRSCFSLREEAQKQQHCLSGPTFGPQTEMDQGPLTGTGVVYKI